VAAEEHAIQATGGRQHDGVLGVFVYGTLRPGGWNHEAWLAPLLARPCRPACAEGLALHHHDGLPAVVRTPTGTVVGEIADLLSDGYDDALALLDLLEGTSVGHYRRVTARVVGGEEVWLWVAGDRLATELGEHTLVRGGDWFDVPGARADGTS
jgi:periplasmic divalent cation tolerance protein